MGHHTGQVPARGILLALGAHIVHCRTPSGQVRPFFSGRRDNILAGPGIAISCDSIPQPRRILTLRSPDYDGSSRHSFESSDVLTVPGFSARSQYAVSNHILPVTSAAFACWLMVMVKRNAVTLRLSAPPAKTGAGA